MLKENLSKVLSIISDGNNLGEKITLVGATKTQSIETINQAISYGLKVVGENRVQEFNQKNELVVGASQHFIGHLQTNKVKYLVGKVDLIHSVDSVNLATAIDQMAKKRQVTQNVLLEVNVSGEASKSGFALNEIENAVETISLTLDSVTLKGLMTMFPLDAKECEIKVYCKAMRSLFDRLKKKYTSFEFLSMGMSNDYQIAIKNGSNMIRLGRTIFGERGGI